MTASRDPQLRATAKKLGAAGFLEKPFDAEVLVKLLNETVDAHSGEVRTLGKRRK